jgi:hypothetical protein
MYKASYKPVSQAIHSALAREGVAIGNTAAVPRVEVHTFVENPSTDKGGAVRVLACVIESVSSKSMEDASGMNATNLEKLDGVRVSGDTPEFRIMGWLTTQLQEQTATSDTQQIEYHVLQSIDFYVQQL